MNILKENQENGQNKSTTSEILDEISQNLSRQIMEEMDQAVDRDDKKTEKENEEADKGADGDFGETEKYASEKGKSKLKTGRMVFCLILGLICITANSFIVNYSMEFSSIFGSINEEPEEEIVKKEPQDPGNSKTPAPIVNTPAPQNTNKVVNILLIGEENVYGDSIGRSDSMMIATINGQQGSLKLTSLMRDIYIAIPEYLPNKLNAAYNNGGGPLLTETIEQNFGIPIDGYVVVDFQALEDIINMLGGVEVTLTEDEAYYLNTTNYISKYEYRNVTAGTQILNGNQAVGYCRVRYRSASNGESNDFGRTYRQRAVLTSLFNAYKNKSLNEMLSIAKDIIPYVSTNIKKADLLNYIVMAVSQGTTELETLRIPVDGTYFNVSVPCGYNYSEALTIDYTENIRIMNEFIYGPDEDGQTPSSGTNSSGNLEEGGYYDEYGVFHSASEAGSEGTGSGGTGLTPPEGYIPRYERYGN